MTALAHHSSGNKQLPLAYNETAYLTWRQGLNGVFNGNQ